MNLHIGKCFKAANPIGDGEIYLDKLLLTVSLSITSLALTLYWSTLDLVASSFISHRLLYSVVGLFTFHYHISKFEI